MSKIPKIIHQIWIGPKKKPKYMDKWVSMNPDFEYILWDNDKVKELFPIKNQHLYNQYDNETRNVWNGRANLLRLEILDKFGGIYIDADCIPNKPIDDTLLDNEFFIAYANEKARPGILNNAVIGSIKGHNILPELINKLNKVKKLEQPSHIFSGPTYISKHIFNNKYDELITIYPSYYFYPNFYRDNIKYDYSGSFKPYTIHEWGTTKNLYK